MSQPGPAGTAAEQLSRRVWRVRAPNPGPMTLTGTNSYLVCSEGQALIIDPGPDIEGHLRQLAAAANELQCKVNRILVTHGHPDHYPGAARLAELTGSPVAAYKEAEFPHDLDLEDEDRVAVGDSRLVAIFTPGHAADHLCFYLEAEDALFTGDNILGQGTTVVAPPRGDMAQYMASLRRLAAEYGRAQVIYGGHGPAINAPAAKYQEYITHRQARQAQLMEALATGPATIPQLVERIYQDVDRRLWPAAGRQVLAYLIMLEREGRIAARDQAAGPLTEEQAALYPAGVVDPVAAAELGLGAEGSDRSGSVRVYYRL